MDNERGNSPPGDQREKELSISLTASSMISALDMINQEAYQANLKRIQEVKEMVQQLETNNETAHKNFLVDQLEKRAEDGREAEIMLARLRSQPRLSETVQFTNNVSSDKAEVMLPTTATLVEVPESQSSYSSPIPTTTSFPQTIQQARPADVQCSLPSQVHQVHSHNPNLFPYYVPPSTVRQPPQHSAAPRSQAPVDGQMGWYTTQNVPPQSGVHNPLPHQSGFQPIQVQQPAQSWSSYPPPVVFLPAADAVPAPGYYTSPPGWIKTAPAHSGPNTGSSSTTYRATQSTASRPPVTTHILPPNLPSLVPASQVQVPLHGVPALSAKIPSGQPLPTRSLPKPAEFQTRPVSTPVSKPVAISELQRPQKPPQQPQSQYQPQQSRLQPQQLPQPPQQPQHHSQPLQTQPQRLPQPPFQHHQQSQELPSQRPLQPPQTHRQTPSQSADRVPSTSVSQPHSQPSQVRDSLPPHPTIMQEQARQGAPRADQATFIKLFQVAVQRGILQLKAFFLQARASGISDEWFRAAINSLPRGVWESIMAQDKQSGTLDAPSSTNVPQQQVPTIPGRNAPVATAQPSPTAAPLIQTTPATQQVAKPSTSTDGRITVAAPGQTSGSYAVQLQYYAQQATKSALSARGANVSANPPGNIPPTNKALATPTRDLPQAQVNVRTPKDANKSTLARDILRSLGKIVPKPCQEMGGEPTDKAKDREGDQLPEVNLAQPVSHTPSPKPPVVPPATSFVLANSPSIPSAKPNVEAELQHVASPNPSTARSVSKAEREQAAVIGPIMIDLTLEDESDDEKGPESTFPIQTSASTATSPQPVFPTNTNTTNHTPLLENLSLEEPVDVAADCDNADVRMYNPPLSLATEENMESELLYPLLGSAEPVSPSFEPLPREASEHPLDGQLPLFLPSPPVSPAHTEPPETDLEMINDEDNNIPSLKRHTVDAELLIPRIRKRRKVYVLIPPAPLYVKKAIKKMKERAMGKDIDSDSDGVGEDEEFQYSHLEQLLIEESKSRLLERRCRWLNCGAILNCAANLLAHLKHHAREEDSEAPFLCRWASCQRQFGVEQDRDVHLERHTIKPLPCPFAGCDKQFNKPVEVMQHEVQHQTAERGGPLMRKPTYRPIVPAIPVRLGPPPYQLPSHRVIPRRVVKCRISAERHAIMGPWILWNIFSPVELSTRKQNASMRSRPTRQVINYDTHSSDPRRDDYDFLQALSSYPAKNPQLDDLDSTLITISASRGLTLWGSGSTTNSAAGSATPEEYTNVDTAVLISAGEETRVEGKADESEVAAAGREDSRPDERQSGQSAVMGEEDAVERMLIL